MGDAVADVARVPVAEQHVAGGRRRRRDPPAVQPFTVLGGRLDLSELETGVRRRSADVSSREVEHRVQRLAQHPAHGDGRAGRLLAA